MPGTQNPIEGVQGFHGVLNALRQRIANLEIWQRQTVGTVGMITQWAGSTPPAGALECNGATFSATRYPALAAVLGGTTLPTISGSPIYVIWTGPQSAV